MLPIISLYTFIIEHVAIVIILSNISIQNQYLEQIKWVNNITCITKFHSLFVADLSDPIHRQLQLIVTNPHSCPPISVLHNDTQLCTCIWNQHGWGPIWVHPFQDFSYIIWNFQNTLEHRGHTETFYFQCVCVL